MFPSTSPDPVQTLDALHDWMGIREPLSIIDLINAGSMEPRLTAILWFLIARKSSLVVAALPQRAGKSTTLAALLSLTPSETTFFPVGNSFSREMVAEVDPTDTYLVVNEVSAGLPHRYLWGPGVEEVLRARSEEKYSVALTLHALTVEDTLKTFTSPPLSISSGLVRGLNTVVILRSASETERGVESIVLLEGQPGGDDLTLHEAARWNEPQNTFAYLDPEGTLGILARRANVTTDQAAQELREREDYLTGIVATPPTESLRNALATASFRSST